MKRRNKLQMLTSKQCIFRSTSGRIPSVKQANFLLWIHAEIMQTRHFILPAEYYKVYLLSDQAPHPGHRLTTSAGKWDQFPPQHLQCSVPKDKVTTKCACKAHSPGISRSPEELYTISFSSNSSFNAGEAPLSRTSAVSEAEPQATSPLAPGDILSSRLWMPARFVPLTPCPDLFF